MCQKCVDAGIMSQEEYDRLSVYFENGFRQPVEMPANPMIDMMGTMLRGNVEACAAFLAKVIDIVETAGYRLILATNQGHVGLILIPVDTPESGGVSVHTGGIDDFAVVAEFGENSADALLQFLIMNGGAENGQ